MIDSLRDALASIERRQKTIEVFAPSPAPADELASQFVSKNVSVTYRQRPTDADRSFVVVRGPEGEFLEAVALESFDALLSPDVHPPWVLAEMETGYDEVFDFLDDTVFGSYDRRQMLATAREIEERAFRVGDGRLYAGFQNAAALSAQRSVYERLAETSGLWIRLFVSDAWTVETDAGLSVTTESGDEIGSFWFVVFDGGPAGHMRCGLIAEERDPGQYYGFWTYDTAMVDDIVSYLEARYGHG